MGLAMITESKGIFKILSNICGGTFAKRFLGAGSYELFSQNVSS